MVCLSLPLFFQRERMVFMDKRSPRVCLLSLYVFIDSPSKLVAALSSSPDVEKTKKIGFI